ncbi:carboxymuconolactone decarboxylase family protein [aff. Roholtiella sp. LEGE 12411]|uniref:carboxymuconolactone decarboxylase family protein n=1 Tax=aff. Roholtiella sp. LEGE 12411 TaxID=1828822 RepID=UPI001882134B|nr:carboxymuconolactone decarboxylase family protein [aff. Roholtiella sp. LEGE 12411]MBE9033593.1 carboxymuconolactone decarboxylase family protein [aff. Roholtiella sp. LEGE 12411]
MNLQTQSILEQIQKSFGFVPNALQAMSAEPALLKAYVDTEALLPLCSLNIIEQELVMLTVSVVNECGYCVAAHSLASKILSSEQVDSLRNRQVLSDLKLQTLRETTEQIVLQQGRLSEQQLSKFLNVGYSRSQLLAIVLIVAFKTIANYSNHINAPELDHVFMSKRWEITS